MIDPNDVMMESPGQLAIDQEFMLVGGAVILIVAVVAFLIQRRKEKQPRPPDEWKPTLPSWYTDQQAKPPRDAARHKRSSP